MSGTRRAGRRSRLLARQRPQVIRHLRVEDDTAAQAELAEAKEALETARFRDDAGAAEAVKAAQKRVAKAAAAVEACYEPVLITALEPRHYEKLAAEHPPRPGREQEPWNSDSFPLALFLACVDTTGEDALTVQEWESLLDTGMSKGEREGLLLGALEANARVPSAGLPSD